MKKLAVIVASMLVSVYAYGQGQILFDTSAAYPQGWAKVDINNNGIEDAGDPLAAGPKYVGQLFGGAGSDANSFTAIGSPLAFGTGDVAGFIIDAVIVTVSDAAGGTAYNVQLRAWDTAATSLVGRSPVLAIPSLGGTTAGGTVLPPSDLSGMVGGALIPVPEPSTIALGLLGAALLLIRRK